MGANKDMTLAGQMKRSVEAGDTEGGVPVPFVERSQKPDPGGFGEMGAEGQNIARGLDGAN